MKFKNRKIGIWGLGVVGQSALHFLGQKNVNISVMDAKKPSKNLVQLLEKYNAQYIPESQKEAFFTENELIIPSPGIDLRPYHQYQDKWLTELDIMQKYFTKPVIAVTGSVGKTTVTQLIADLLVASGKKVCAAGNIGLPMLSLVVRQQDLDFAVLEVSSFQLAYTKTFAPFLAILTNVYPNHLDWHGTKEDYFAAKCNLFAHQTKTQHALLPQQFKETITISGVAHYFDPKQTIKSPKTILPVNWHIAQAALSILGFGVSQDTFVPQQKHAHRIEYVATINNVDFYNDSKATIPESTLAALAQFPNKPIYLFLGGLSKGVDRSHLIAKLPNNVKFVYCFGKEAEQLTAFCKQQHIFARSFENLEGALDLCIQNTKPNSVVLFSPAGSSFDLFTNYKERGKCFKGLVIKQLNY